MAQNFLEQGILPQQFYDSSYSDMQDALNAKSRKDRIQDPFEVARQAGLI
ncbi:hypothetical protein [Loigolactobacillus jiayinensis]|uniref:Uncharacterized protein n=1 Tax=Loigolactobacillus jiayinensis TaxID=2486016 RepID=A0ABW1RCG8_9LACO|nr:hypothetical protein [Loigolactobacillus jiayinensis]